MFKKGEEIASGSEKTVYENEDDFETVIAEIDRGNIRSSRQLKSAYYLQKIRHCLFPDNFPDIRLAVRTNRDEKYFVMDKIETEPGHKAFVSSKEITPESAKLAWEFYERIKSDPEKEELDTKMKDAGLFIDRSVGNYSRDKIGNLINLDIETAWDYNGDELAVFFKADKAREAIKKIPDETTRRRASHYLERLEQLLEEERAEILEK